MTPRSLPQFIEPMLARLSEPRDLPMYRCEIKWDGFRALCFVEDGGYRLVGRQKTDFTSRFPKLGGLAALPRGTVLDGEIVMFTGGKPNFTALLNRRGKSKAGQLRYVAFDLLYSKFRPIMKCPYEERRAELEPLIAAFDDPILMMSKALAGSTLKVFEKVSELGLEGIVAKRVDSVYEPGERSGAWLKFKKRQDVVCSMIGYEPSAERGFKSLILAAEVEGTIQFVGQVGSGIDSAMHAQLLSMFSGRERSRPVVPCPVRGRWLEPGLFCTVSFLEWTPDQRLRSPVFEKLHVV